MLPGSHDGWHSHRKVYAMAQNTLTSRQVEDLARLDAEAASITADLRSGQMDCPPGMTVDEAIAKNDAFKAEVAKHITDGATYVQACQIAGLEQVMGLTCEDAKAVVMGQEDDVSVDATCPLDGTTDDVEDDDTDGIPLAPDDDRKERLLNCARVQYEGLRAAIENDDDLNDLDRKASLNRLERQYTEITEGIEDGLDFGTALRAMSLRESGLNKDAAEAAAQKEGPIGMEDGVSVEDGTISQDVDVLGDAPTEEEEEALMEALEGSGGVGGGDDEDDVL